MDIPRHKTSCFYLAQQPASVRAECVKIRTPVFTGLALIAFASNSVLCRMALGAHAVDAAGFSMLRLISGALVLWLLTAVTQPKPRGVSVFRGGFVSAAMLFSYAVAFSFAFVSLNTAAGALILFGSVQATMFIAAVMEGQKPTPTEYLGLGTAMCGLGYMVFPGLGAPPLWAAALMMLAGISWGIYSLRGRGSGNPVADTRNNFLRTLPFVVLLGVVAYPYLQFSAKGVLLAILSGGGASALGYIIWYAALQDLSAKHGALVQLMVPVLAASGGVVFLSEPLVLRLVVAAALILGGIALAIAYPGRGGHPAPEHERPSRTDSVDRTP